MAVDVSCFLIINHKIHKNVTQGWINFKELALKNGYEEGLTLHLINRNGNYCPQNCRWENAIDNQLVLPYKGKHKH